MFENLKALLNEYTDNQKKDRAFFIENGFCSHWPEQNRIFSAEGIRRYSTATRWAQYQAGEISREKAVEFATRRAMKELEKEYSKKIWI